MQNEKARSVFIPKEWHGINEFPPLELDSLESMPMEHRPHARPIIPKLYEHVKKEFDKMSTYMCVESHAPIAAPLVITPKETAPLIRFCGDYVWHNQYLRMGHYFIPNVPQSFAKAQGFKYCWVM